ncbi:hypothetical protein R6Q59_019563 [Mikania micrantha]
MAGGGRGLDETATWSVAMVCAVIVVLSIILEKMLHHVGHYLRERHKVGLLEALEKIKTELMVLGFISLILTFCQNYIAAVCVSKVLTKDFLPCKKQPDGKPPLDDDDDDDDTDTRRKLLWYGHRHLGGDGPPKECKPGYEELITVSGLHQLHIFIFFLAVFHVIYSALTMIGGRAKIREWKVWEKDILQQQASAHDPSKFRLTKETSFVKGHVTNLTGLPIFFYIICFFRQFFTSVGKSDYFTMRHGFISVIPFYGLLRYFICLPMLKVNSPFIHLTGTHAMVWLSLFPVVNSFEITHFFWIWYEFGLDSCFHEKPVLQYGRVLIGIVVQIICSYSILPLYALISQMGSKMKRSIFDDQTSKALKHWHKNASRRRESRGRSGQLPTNSLKLSTPSINAQAHVAPSNSNSPNQSAHIVASVDIPQDKHKSTTSNPNLH